MDGKRLEEYLKVCIDNKRTEMTHLKGEISALESTLSVLKQFEEQERLSKMAGK